MDEDAGPVVGRRRLAAELRRLRSASGKTINEIAVALECSPGKISRIETGVVGVRIQDARELLDLYGVSGIRREELLELVRQSRGRAWWHEYSDIVPRNSAILFGLEHAATRLSEHSISLVPGLLQTEEYARAIIGAAKDVDSATIDRRVELRLRRQEVLNRVDPPILHVILDEGVLLRPIGGNEIMADQLRYLREIQERPSITLQILPLAAGVHPAAGVSFTIFGFSYPADPEIVYVEQLSRNTYLDEQDDINLYKSAFDQAAKLSLDLESSASLVERAISSYR